MSIETSRRAAAALGLAAAVLAAPRASAEKSASPRSLVTLAEVSSAASAGTTRLTDVTELLRRDAEAEIAAIDWTKESIRRRVAVSAAIVRLESTRLGERSLQASCTVSAAVRDAERGTLLAIVEGRARAEDSPAAALEAERDALAGAVRGAITAVPEAIRRSQ